MNGITEYLETHLNRHELKQGFTRLADTPTFYNHILDIFTTNKPSLSCHVVLEISDYEALYIESKLAVYISVIANLADFKRITRRKTAYTIKPPPLTFHTIGQLHKT